MCKYVMKVVGAQHYFLLYNQFILFLSSNTQALADLIVGVLVGGWVSLSVIVFILSNLQPKLFTVA